MKIFILDFYYDSWIKIVKHVVLTFDLKNNEILSS